MNNIKTITPKSIARENQLSQFFYKITNRRNKSKEARPFTTQEEKKTMHSKCDMTQQLTKNSGNQHKQQDT